MSEETNIPQSAPEQPKKKRARKVASPDAAHTEPLLTHPQEQPAARPKFSPEKFVQIGIILLLVLLNLKIFGAFDYFARKNADTEKLAEGADDIRSLNQNLLLLARKVDDIGKSLDGVRKSPKDNSQNDELRGQVKDLARKVDVLTAKINPSANIAEPTALTDVNSSKRKQFLFKIKLNAFYKEKKRFPDTIDELKKCLGEIPQEDQSKSTRLSLDKDYRGGWYYDKAKGVMQPNVN